MVTAQPDQAQFTAAVVTQGSTAQEAAQQNATLTTAVIAVLKSKMGTSGMVQTISYSVSPRYGNPPSSAIIGYTATNTVMVTSFDLNLVGALIDTANQAGANSVGGVTFGLQDSSPQMQQALTRPRNKVSPMPERSPPDWAERPEQCSRRSKAER